MVDLASEKGASSWLAALPIRDHGFYLHKSVFRDAICLRYGWKPECMPDKCVCGSQFSVEHALTCVCGGFRSLSHNEIRDLSATLLANNRRTDPELQPLTGQTFSLRSANTEANSRLDIRAQGFWDER